MRTTDPATESADRPGAGRRILVLFEPGRSGEAAVELARDLASRDLGTVTVVGVAPRTPITRGCLPSARDYDATVCEAVASDLERAGDLLRAIGSRAESRLLVEGRDPSLEDLVSDGRFDLVLLPARRRLLRAGHPVAARLRAIGRGDVRIVDARAWA